MYFTKKSDNFDLLVAPEEMGGYNQTQIHCLSVVNDFTEFHPAEFSLGKIVEQPRNKKPRKLS